MQKKLNETFLLWISLLFWRNKISGPSYFLQFTLHTKEITVQLKYSNWENSMTYIWYTGTKCYSEMLLTFRPPMLSKLSFKPFQPFSTKLTTHRLTISRGKKIFQDFAVLTLPRPWYHEKCAALFKRKDQLSSVVQSKFMQVISLRVL